MKPNEQDLRVAAEILDGWNADDIYTVALACLPVHRVLDERMSHAEMETAVLRAIEANGGLVLPEGNQ